MNTARKKLLVLLVSLCTISALSLSACDVKDQVQQTVDYVSKTVAQAIEGDVTGEIGKEYKTKWFNFTVDTLSTTSSIYGHTASDGNILVVARITETNNSGSSQPLGTFDWFVDSDVLTDYIFPLDPLNDTMMPEEFQLADGETVTYDVVVEYPADLPSPVLMYTEADDQGQTYNSFRIPIS